MKNPMLARAASKAGTPMQANYSPMKKQKKPTTEAGVDSATAEAKFNAANEARANAQENQSANVDDLGTKEEVATKAKSPMMKKGEGPFGTDTKTTNVKSLRDAIAGVRTKAADLVGKLHKGFDKPLATEIPNINKVADSFNQSSPKNTIQNVGKLGNVATRLTFGVMPSILGKLGGQILENVLRPGKQSHLMEDQIIKSLDDAEKEVKSGTKAKKPMKAKRPMKAKKPMKAKSPVKGGKKTLSIKDSEWQTMSSKEKDDYIYRNTPGGNPYTNPKSEFYGKKKYN